MFITNIILQSFAGEAIPAELVEGLMLGDIDPHTREKVDYPPLFPYTINRLDMLFPKADEKACTIHYGFIMHIIFT